MAELLTRSNIPTYEFEMGAIYTQQYPTYDEMVAADNAGKKLFIFDGYGYLEDSVDLHLYGHKASNSTYNPEYYGYCFSEAVGEYLYRGKVFRDTGSYSEEWMYYGGFKFENYANGTSAITLYNYASNDKYAENIAVYNYTTGHTMPKILTYYPGGSPGPNGLSFCNGIIYAGTSTAGRSTTAWTITFSTFYDLYMGSMGALSIAETGDSSDNQTMFNNLKPQILKHLKFYKSGGGGTTLMNISWNTVSSTQIVGKYGGATPIVYIQINISSSTPSAYITMTT